MNKDPFFSVVIPTLNEEMFLPLLLESLTRQTFKSFEVIVVDGGSEDKTIEVASPFKNKLAKFTIIKSLRANVSYQRNIGAERSRGKYLVFFDADVTIPKSFLQKIHAKIKKQKLIYITTWLKADSTLTHDKLIATLTSIGIEASLFIEKPFAPGFNIIVQKDVFNHIGGFDEKVVHAEDHELTQRCYSAGIKMTILKQPRLTLSLRRLRKEGYFAILSKYTRSSLYVLLKGPIKKALYEYPMGGHLYEGTIQKPKGGFIKFEKTVLKRVKKLLTTKL